MGFLTRDGSHTSFSLFPIPVILMSIVYFPIMLIATTPPFAYLNHAYRNLDYMTSDQYKALEGAISLKFDFINLRSQ